MNVLIIEDEPLAAARIEDLLSRHDTVFDILAILSSVEDSSEWLRENSAPDLIFADIHLADGLCFEIFNQIQPSCPVIFTTSYDQYALEAFEVNGIDYLLKPIKYERFCQALDKLERIQKGNGPALSDLIQYMEQKQAPTSKHKSRFMVKSGKQIRVVKTGDIAYFYSDQKISLLVSKAGKRYPVDYSLDKLIELLDPNIFFRINRRFIIHLDAAAKIHPYFKGRLKLELDPPINEEIVVSSERSPHFKQWLDQ